MNRLSTALATSTLLALAACGGGAGDNQASADNAAATAGADNVTLPPDENAAAGAGDSLENQLNAIDTGNALGNGATDNSLVNTSNATLGVDANATANSATNAQ